MTVPVAPAAASSAADASTSRPPSCPPSTTTSTLRHRLLRRLRSSVSSVSSLSSSSPRHRSAFRMALSLSAHFAGYEFARNAALALFTSETTGFGGGGGGGGGGNKEGGGGGGGTGTAWALPLAVGCVAPFSVALLWLYTRILDRRGPRYALRFTTVMFAGVLFFSGTVLTRSGGADGSTGNVTTSVDVYYSKYLVFALFVYQNASVQLLCTQHWGFLTSVLTSEEGSKWFAPAAGLGSVSSTLAAGGVSKLAEYGGLNVLLHLGGWTVLLSAWFAEGAYDIAEEHGFAPSSKDARTKKKPPRPKAKGDGGTDTGRTGAEASHNTAAAATTSHEGGIIGLARRASTLFRRVPVLGALFVEVLFSQTLSSLLNYLFLTGVRDAVHDDSERAGWTGRCYAWINGISGVMQFGALPVLMGWCKEDSRWVWGVAPSVMAMLTLSAALRSGATEADRSASLFWIGAPFLTMKTIEYSLRSFAVEMLYVSLDYESRFVGKEVIGLFANRIGKSGMAVSLALVAALWGETEYVKQKLRALSFGVACGWWLCSLRLRRLLPPPPPPETKNKRKKKEGKTHPS